VTEPLSGATYSAGEQGRDPGPVLDPATQAILASGVVAVLRAPTAKYFAVVTEALVDVGITSIEVTLTTPDGLRTIEALNMKFPTDVRVGAGTVLTEADASRAVDAGAAFIVSPFVSADIVQAGLRAGVPSYPGALTPTEFMAASQAGASIVKLFPASSVGPEYLRALQGPFPNLRIMPTGGVNIENVSDWLRAGASAVGLGGPLTGDALSGGSLAELRDRAQTVVRQVAEARAQA
jgi:2-dehydro-3-deoxyphosphogluconate aldolase/(4S)-4-hydroxy-2-oxoglutarate aldolase